MKVKIKRFHDEEDLVNDNVDKTYVDYEDERDKCKEGNKNDGEEEEEEERRENEGTNDIKDDDIINRGIQNYIGLRTASNTNDREDMEEESREIEMQHSGGDHNNNDENRSEGIVDDNCWCIKPPGPESQDSNDEIKLSVIKKVFLTRLKKSSTPPNENNNEKTNECRKKTSLESIQLDNHKSEDNYTHKKLRKKQYTNQNKQLEGKEHDNFTKSDQKIRSKHSYQNETSERNLVDGTSNEPSKRNKTCLTANCLKASHSEKSEVGPLKRKLLEDDAHTSLNKKTKYDGHNGKLLQYAPVSETYGKSKIGTEMDNEFADSQKRTSKYNETDVKTIKINENDLEKKQSVKHQWVINTRSQSQSNQCSSKHEATRLVLKKMKSNEPDKSHTHESSIKHDTKQKYSVQKDRNISSMLRNSSKKTKRDIQDRILRSSKHAISSNGTKTRTQVDQNRTARQVEPKSVSSITTRRSDRDASSRSNRLNRTTETNTSYTPKRRNTIWTPDNFLLQGNPEKKHTSIKLKLNPTDQNLQKVDTSNIMSDQTNKIIAHENKSSKKYDCSKSLINKSPIVVLKDIFPSGSRSRTIPAHKLKVSCPETKTTEHVLSQRHRVAHMQSKTPFKIRVKDRTQTSSSHETSNKSNKTIPATNKQKRKNSLNDLKSDKRHSNRYKTSSGCSNNLNKPWNSKENITGKPQICQTKLLTSNNVKDNKNTEQRTCLNTLENEYNQIPSLKVSIRLSALSDDWLEHNIMNTNTPTTDQTSSHEKNVNSEHINSTISNKSVVELSKQSLGTYFVPYSETDQFNKQSKDSKIRMEKISSSAVSNLNHSKDEKQRRTITNYADSKKCKKCGEETRMSGANLNISEIATQEDNTDYTKTPRCQPKKKRHHIRKSTANDNNSRRCNQKAFRSGNKINSNKLHSLSGYSFKNLVVCMSLRIKNNKKITCVLPTRYKATNKSVLFMMSTADKKRKKCNKKSKNEIKTCKPEVKFTDKDDMAHSKVIESPQNVTNGKLVKENDKMENIKKEEKLGLQRGIIENENTDTREVGPHDTLKLNDRSGTIIDGTVLKSRIWLPSSTQRDECKVSTVKYQEISNPGLSRKNVDYTIANSTRKINMSSLNQMLYFNDTNCTETETCDRFDLNHLLKDNMTSKGYFENTNKTHIKKTVYEVDDNECKTLKSVDWAAQSHLVSKTGINYNEMFAYMKAHSSYVYNTNKQMKYFGNDFDTAIYKNLSAISFPVTVHSFEHLTSILNYILQRLSQKRTENTCLFSIQNEFFPDIRTDHCLLFSGGKVLNNYVEPFYDLNKRIEARGIKDDSNHKSFEPKLMFNGSPSFQIIDSLENGGSQLQRCVNNTNPMNFSIFFKGINQDRSRIDPFLETVDHEEVIQTEDVENEEPELFSYPGMQCKAFQQKVLNTKNTNSNLIKAGYGSDEDITCFFSDGVNFDSCQEHSEQSTANPKRDLHIGQNYNLFRLDAAVTLSSQRCTELRNKGDNTARCSFNHIFSSSDFGVTEKNQNANNFDIKNLTFKKDQLNQDTFYDCPLVTKYFQEETNEESVVSTVFSLQTNNIVEPDKTTAVSGIASENLEYSARRSNFENNLSGTEIIDLTSDENNETYEQRKSCIEYSYPQPRINCSCSKSENTSQQDVTLQAVSKAYLYEKYSTCDDDDVLVLYDSGQKSQHEDSNVHVNNGISFYDEDTVLYVPNRFDENIIKDNTTINCSKELECSNSFENFQEEQDISMEEIYLVEDTQDECDSTMVDTTDSDDEVQQTIQTVKADLFTFYSIVFDARIKKLCLKMGNLLFNKMKEEIDCKCSTSKDCEYNLNKCQGSKQSDKASCGNNTFTHTNLFSEYFYDFYSTVCSKNIDDSYQRFILVMWLKKVYNKVSNLSEQKYSLSQAKQCLVKLLPPFFFEIPTVADFLRKDRKTLQKDFDVTRRIMRDFKAANKRK